ncbi:uncharacterized protein LOC114325999 [Diabrotica virgifera virgifera]|uniref:Uncharacterized protein LOC114325999 n=1 Tax=Diabrotica virgifera virgifera TaxID=50390 RepID=A0A6P7F502_DIAVI|nr:uncharacterized protein LOC114325999 [Diabrotica virgifera virgifera]
MAGLDSFLTSTRRDYKWPYPKPMVSKPSEPPASVKHNNDYVARLVEPYCHCDFHLYEPEMGRYKKLAQKEMQLYQELEELSKKMAILSSDILDHPCDTDDDKMKTIYQTDYIKKGLPLTSYKKLTAAIDSPVGIPVKGEIIGLGRGYRDPTKFRFNTFPKPFVDVCSQIGFQRTPTAIEDWFVHRTGTSEYHDTINNMGLNIMKSRQQYTEPLLSTRGREDDPCR